MIDKETIIELKKNGKPVYIYGNMLTAKNVCQTLLKNGISPSAFVIDSFAFKGNDTIQGIPVKCIDDVEDIAGSNIVIGFDNVEKARVLLSARKYLVYNLFHIVSLEDSFHWTNDFIQNNSMILNSFKTSLADEKSRRVFTALSSLYMGEGNIEQLLSVSEGNQYFNELTFCNNSSNEFFIDCGAFDGDTIKKYVEFTGKTYKKILAMEPLPENLVNLRKNTCNIENLDIVEYGTWKENAILLFNPDTSASSVSETGSVQVKMNSIDNIVNNDERVTLIKMDIEGSEFEALQGAKNTIERCLPKLAICVYHKYDDLIRIPTLIRSFKGASSYKFYLRHHSNRLTETVLYAIPS